jgi:hypothetical protein
MQITAQTYGTIARAILADEVVSASDAGAIVRLAELAVGIDLDEFSDERDTLDKLTRLVAASAGIDRDSVRPLSPLPIDAEERRAWLRVLTQHLTSMAACELAYALVYVLIVSDVELGPIETEFLEELRRTLGIQPDRAAELAEQVSEIVTPGASELPVMS